MSFRGNMDKIYYELESLAKRAGDAHKDFRKKWAEGCKACGGYAQYKKTPQYEGSLEHFRTETDNVWKIIKHAFEHLSEGGTEDMAAAFAYLKIKSRHFRSGYTKENLCRKLKKIKLTPEQKDILTEIILEQIEAAGREFKEYGHLIPLIKSPELEKQLRYYPDGDSPKVKSRIEWITKAYFH